MKIFLILVITIIGAILLSLNIPFIYSNIELQIFIVGYALLYFLYMLIMIQQKKYGGKRYKPYKVYADFTKIKDKILFLTSNFIMPLGAGWLLTLTTPIWAEFLATSLEIREYQVSEIIQTSGKMGNKVRVLVTDIRGESASFIASPELAINASMHEHQRIIVIGRRLPVGFVIDSINDIKR